MKEIYICGFTPYTPQANENSYFRQILICIIGLITMLQASPESDIIVQLSKSITDELKFLRLSALTEALSSSRHSSRA